MGRTVRQWAVLTGWMLLTQNAAQASFGRITKTSLFRRSSPVRSSTIVAAAITTTTASSLVIPDEDDEFSMEAASALRSMTFCNLDMTKEPQLLCEFLMEIGACSTSITDADRGTPLEQPIFREPGNTPFDADRVVIYKYENSVPVVPIGTDVWNRCNVTAHFPSSMDLTLVAEMVQEALNIPLGFSVQQVPNRDWVIHVQQGWKPIMISGLVLRFPWHSDDHVKEVVGDERNMVELQLEGGVAFGTGEHPTTQMCLMWIQKLVQENTHVFNIMDYGSGSGVLGMAACAFNDKVKAVGVDIDVDAVRIANANAAINGLAMMNYLPPLEETTDNESKSLLMKAHHQKGRVEILPAEANGPIYDVCVANILARPLVTLAPTLASLVRPNGYLGLSGILTSQANMVMEAYRPYFDNVKVEQELGGWIIITGTRKS